MRHLPLLPLLFVCAFCIAPPELAALESASAAVERAGGLEKAPLSTVLRLAESASAARRSSLAAAAAGAHARRLAAGDDLTASQADLVEAWARTAAALRDAREYSSALRAVAAARAAASGAGGAATAVLLRLQASVSACSGDSSGALAAVDAAAVARAEAGLPPLAGPADALEQIDLLRRTAANEANYSAAIALARAADSVVAGFIARGPWLRGDQLPLRYVAGLAARPWHSVGAHFPALRAVADALEAAAPALRVEWAALRAADEASRVAAAPRLLLDEPECLHNASAGSWTYHTVNAPWHEQDGDGCSTATPAACALWATVRALGTVRLLRAGYSALSAGARIEPHFGTTNAQLKFHLGVDVPARAADGEACAFMRVGTLSATATAAAAPLGLSGGALADALAAHGSPPPHAGAAVPDGRVRAWRQGRAFLFDDSFEHEVVNNCDAERVVFQLVFEHPELAAVAEAASLGSDGVPKVVRPLPPKVAASASFGNGH